MTGIDYHLLVVFCLEIVICIATVIAITALVFVLRAEHLSQQRVREMWVLLKHVKLVRSLVLEIGTFPPGAWGQIKEIYERSPSPRDKARRDIAIIDFSGYPVAMTPGDLEWYFVERKLFRWHLPQEEHAERTERTSFT